MSEDSHSRERVIDEDLIRYLCRLSRLELTAEEIPVYTEQIRRIVQFVETLDRVPTDDVPPTSHVLDLANVTRDDVPRPSESREAILSNAPSRTTNSFKVPRVV